MDKQPFADLQRWSEEVARDPASPAFLPLAQSYRRQGRFAAAIQLCVRALGRNPSHLEGHALLAQLYLESGDQERAGDEWSFVLRLDPDHFEAHRGLGFFWLERGRHKEAREHLERAAELRPNDAAVKGALALLSGEAADNADDAASRSTSAPGEVFAPVLADSACLGILVLDGEGLVLGGGVKGELRGDLEMMAALLGGALADAGRVLAAGALGGCRGLTIEVREALLRLAPLGESLSLLILADPETSEVELDRLMEDAVELGRDLPEVRS